MKRQTGPTAMTTQAKTVGIVAPSGFIADPSVIDRAAQRFAARGWQVQAGDTCFERYQRFAGPDALRLAELQGFCTDRSVDLVVAARGGYGLTRLLDRIDFAAIRRIDRPIVGYSDFTAFSLAYLARAGGISFQGPSATDFGAPVADDFTIESFFATLESPRAALGFDAAGPDCDVRGRLWGGNLALVCSLVGTPYFPRVRGGIVFLEDVNEPAYRIERMLVQLEQAGVLGRQRAVVLGDFAPVPEQANDHGFDLARVIAGVRERLEIPVVTGLPFGHLARKATLPVGAPARLTVADGRAELHFHGYPNLR